MREARARRPPNTVASVAAESGSRAWAKPRRTASAGDPARRRCTPSAGNDALRRRASPRAAGSTQPADQAADARRGTARSLGQRSPAAGATKSGPRRRRRATKRARAGDAQRRLLERELRDQPAGDRDPGRLGDDRQPERDQVERPSRAGLAAPRGAGTRPGASRRTGPSDARGHDATSRARRRPPRPVEPRRRARRSRPAGPAPRRRSPSRPQATTTTRQPPCSSRRNQPANGVGSRAVTTRTVVPGRAIRRTSASSRSNGAEACVESRASRSRTRSAWPPRRRDRDVGEARSRRR